MIIMPFFHIKKFPFNAETGEQSLLVSGAFNKSESNLKDHSEIGKVCA